MKRLVIALGIAIVVTACQAPLRIMNTANAASITTKMLSATEDLPSVPAIYIVGVIDVGDGKKFAEAISRFNGGAIVYLYSPGGDAAAGLEIGYAIRAKQKYETVAPPKENCASMCALIWLAGNTRWIYSTSHVGFHAMAWEKGGVSSSWNALVGAYLVRIGLSDDAIYYLTKASPESMEWLTEDKANQLGIVAKTLD